MHSVEPLAGPTKLGLDSDRTRDNLEWVVVLDTLAGFCRTEPGEELARELPLPDSWETARAWATQSREAIQLLAADEPLPDPPNVRVGTHVDRTRAGGVLGPSELFDLAAVLRKARSLRRFLSSRRDRAPALADALSTDPMLDDAADELERCVDETRQLKDDASLTLRELREKRGRLKARISRKLEAIAEKHATVLQDDFVTDREGRYVIPIRADAHERVAGIVHATSASGATVFIEPEAVVDLGNELKLVEAEVEREERAICARLSDMLHEVIVSLDHAARALAWSDVRAATARWAQAAKMTVPQWTSEPIVSLVDARHPLLVRELGDRVIPTSVEVRSGRAIVVSGPNAGGKTVALKTVGLAVLMTARGLPFPCDPGSTIGTFDEVLTDIGDDQSISMSLSTFTAQVKNLGEILDRVHPGTLVLLDEIAGGTDPREGEALAAAVLDHLTRRGGAVMATTHYQGLKVLASADERFDNAAVGFDFDAMRPTFELRMGVAGASSALAVASRYGLPPPVLDTARAFLSDEGIAVDRALERMHDAERALVLAKRAADDRAEEAARAKQRYDEALEAATSKARETVAKETEQVRRALDNARASLERARKRLRSKQPTKELVKGAERDISEVAGDFAIGGVLADVGAAQPAREGARARELRVGMEVRVPRLNTVATIQELRDDGVVVQAGALKLRVGRDEVFDVARLPASAARRASVRDPSPGAASEPTSVDPRSRENTCDVRGLQTDDALAMVETFLDRAALESRRVVYVVHGHGSGALRDGLRRELPRSPYVREVRGATQQDGGEAVTLVFLR